MSSSGWLCSQSKKNNKVSKRRKNFPIIFLAEGSSKASILHELNLHQTSIKDYCVIAADKHDNTSLNAETNETHIIDLSPQGGHATSSATKENSNYTNINVVEVNKFENHQELTKASDGVDVKDREKENEPGDAVTKDQLNDNDKTRTKFNLVCDDNLTPTSSNVDVQNLVKPYEPSESRLRVENESRFSLAAYQPDKYHSCLPTAISDCDSLTFDSQEPLIPFVPLPMFSEFTLSSQK